MESAANILESVPTEICGCIITRVFTEDQSFLAVGPGDRAVVLKKIDPDCLIDKTLHPVVRDRLSRVRELAHPSVANLFGVEREGADAYLMWEYVDGVGLDFYAAANRASREVSAVAREFVLAVDLLHLQGIVHGALIGSNIIVTPGGAVRLTHISPLIFTDVQVDVECVWNLLDLAAEQLGERGTALSALARQARERKMPLRELATRLGPLIDAREAKKPPEVAVAPESSPRQRALIGAALAIILGLALAFVAWHFIQSGRFSTPDSFHRQFRVKE